VTRTQVLRSPNSGNFVNATSTNHVACQGGSGPCGQSAGGVRVGMTFVSSTRRRMGGTSCMATVSTQDSGRPPIASLTRQGRERRAATRPTIVATIAEDRHCELSVVADPHRGILPRP
jgi:hypothetical protein